MPRGIASRARDGRALTPTLSQSTGRGGRRGGGAGFGVSVKSQRLAHDVERALFHFFIDAADVFAEDAYRDELHAAEEQDAEDDRREPAAGFFVEREESDEVVKAQHERDAGDDEPRV